MLSIPQSLFSGTSKGILLIGETLNEPGAKGEVRLGEGVERAGEAEVGDAAEEREDWEAREGVEGSEPCGLLDSLFFSEAADVWLMLPATVEE